MNKKREFRVDNIHENKIPYSALTDKHLEYFFANRKNRHILVKTKVVNRKNQILDRDICRMIDTGTLIAHNKFRMRQSKPKKDNRAQF